MKNKSFIGLAVILVVASFVAGYWYNQQRGTGSGITGSRKILYYVDPMNPGFKSDKPGIAPCGMPLEPVYAGHEGPTEASKNSNPLPPGTVKITPDRQLLIGIRVAQVERKPSTHTVRVLGRVAPDEARLFRINSSSDLWVRRVYPPTTGSFVKRDELLMSFYNTNFLSAAGAYMYALGTADRFKDTNPEQMASFNYQIRQAVEALQNLGVSDTQIKEMERTRKMSDLVDVRSPTDGIVLARTVTLGQWVGAGTELYRIADLSRVWIFANFFEKEATLFKPGMQVKVSASNMDKTFTAQVSKVLPEFDASTRTMRVRLEAANPGYVLRPDMFVDIELPVVLPAAITVPPDALIDTGLKKTVYVDKGNGIFEPRRVESGWRFGDKVEITGGLMRGEKVVVSGTFLIDSESRMRIAAQGIRSEGKKDPVCGMYVDEMKADTSGRKGAYKGQTYFFCSEECKKEFEKDPKKYAEVKAIDKAEAGGRDIRDSRGMGQRKNYEAPTGHPASHGDQGMEMKGGGQDLSGKGVTDTIRHGNEAPAMDMKSRGLSDRTVTDKPESLQPHPPGAETIKDSAVADEGREKIVPSPKGMPDMTSHGLEKPPMEMKKDGEHPGPSPQQAPVKE